ncbi:MAG: restriction endonuclease subunit S [Gammaproteobacteria bacterium]|nr:restriction endonuclease subunit S [Gammaproteobacteria bacterium]
MTWPIVTIGEICDVVSGATPKTSRPEFWDGNIPWVTPKDLSQLGRKHLNDTLRHITDLGLKRCSTKMLPAQSFLLSSRAPIGLVAINTIPVCTNQGFKSLVPRFDLVSPDYLFWWLKAERAHIRNKGRGATFKEVSKKIVEDLQVPLPPLNEQKRIAGILDKADALRIKRRDALARLDTLTQSIFLDMFGDPATNPQGWQVVALRSLGRVTTGGTPPSSKEGMFGGAIPFITPADLESGQPIKRTVTDAGAGASRTVSAGATLVCCIGATIGKIGKSTVRSAFNQQINAVEWGERINTVYGVEVMRFFKPTIVAWGSSTTLPILKKSSFERIEIPVPPLANQREFAVQMEGVKRVRAAHRVALSKSTELFGALQAIAFRGSL